jgi:hypothetical protein
MGKKNREVFEDTDFSSLTSQDVKELKKTRDNLDNFIKYSEWPTDIQESISKAIKFASLQMGYGKQDIINYPETKQKGPS